MVGNVGAVRMRSSRELSKALDVLTAVGGDKDKIRILGEIKAALHPQTILNGIFSGMKKTWSNTMNGTT